MLMPLMLHFFLRCCQTLGTQKVIHHVAPTTAAAQAAAELLFAPLASLKMLMPLSLGSLVV